MNPTNEVLIAVMGLTGAGKSSLIQNATGDSSVHVENNLKSGTQEIKAYDTWINGIRYVLVDTPGFDDPMKSDAAVVDKILQWLENSYRDGRQLSGVIYLHSIAEPRMQGSALRNMRMFRKLCGPECFKNVVLATTFWTEVAKSIGEKREKELAEKDEFWGLMVKKESQVVRLENDKDSALEVISLIGQEDKITLQAQKEIILLNKSREETAAAELVNEQAKLAQERQQKLEKERERAERELAANEAEKKRAAKVERAALAATMRARERINREQREQREREENELRESKKRAQEEAAKVERDRAAKEKAGIKEREEAQRSRQLAATQAAAKKRADYYKNFRCANITPRGNCDKCGNKLSRWKYYYHCCHCFAADNYWHCGRCGNNCGKAEHPWMRQGLTDDCIVM